MAFNAPGPTGPIIIVSGSGSGGSTASSVWQPGTTYAPGATVVPLTQAAPISTQPANPSFSDGTLTGWNAMPGWYGGLANSLNGGGQGLLAANSGTNITLINTNLVPVTVGQSITATCLVAQGSSSAGDATCSVALFWYDASHNLLSNSLGNVITSSNYGSWQKSTVTAAAPASSAYAAIGANGLNVTNKGPLGVTSFAWNYVDSGASDPLVFTAVQAAPAKSGATEPLWPTTIGATVVDGGVTWEAGAMTSVTWTAGPLLKSSGSEPSWPTTVGSMVNDSSIIWVCTTPQITDPNCPQSKNVAMGASKIFADGGDVVRYSATSDPTDWTSIADAGFLPYGEQTYGKNPILAIGLYRSNLVVFNADGFQMWQIDPDPANMSLLDAMPSGSSYQQALSPVSNDLFFLTSLGVRSMGISGGSGNLEAGDVGVPIDAMVQPTLDFANANGLIPLATYYAALGQYWLAFPGTADDVFF